MESSHVLQATRNWLERVVVGLTLCPFASQPLSRNQIRLAVSQASSFDQLSKELLSEMAFLLEHEPDELETSLLIIPGLLGDFEEYLDFVAWGEEQIEAIGAEGTLQIATFHPAYRFADADSEDAANFSNRSPYPMIHFLREESVAEAIAHHPDVEGIPERNVAKLRALGFAHLQALRAACLGT
ncbi:MAG: DUF1415 domain-containing protein [Bacteroidota bacterium]